MRISYYMGDRDLPSVVLSVGERAALARASEILFRLRELRQDADDDLTTDVALAAHTCAEIAAESRLPITAVQS